MSLTPILGTIATIMSLATAIFGGGLLRQILKHNAEMAVSKYRQQEAEKRLTEMDRELQQARTEISLLNRDVKSFDQHIKKLDMLAEINAKLSGVETSISFMRDKLGLIGADIHK